MNKKLTSSLVVAALSVGNSFAAVVSFDFTAVVTGTSTVWDGSEITGSASYDDDLTPTVGPPTALSADQLESVSVTAFGQVFTALDDAELGVLPSFTYIPTLPQDLRAFIFLVSEDPMVSNPIAIDAPQIGSFEIEIVPSPASQTDYIANVTVTVVPEPSSALLLIASAGILGFRRRR